MNLPAGVIREERILKTTKAKASGRAVMCGYSLVVAGSAVTMWMGGMVVVHTVIVEITEYSGKEIAWGGGRSLSVITLLLLKLESIF